MVVAVAAESFAMVLRMRPNGGSLFISSDVNPKLNRIFAPTVKSGLPGLVHPPAGIILKPSKWFTLTSWTAASLGLARDLSEVQGYLEQVSFLIK